MITIFFSNRRGVYMQDKLERFYADENGQGVTEYALVLSVIAIGAATIIIALNKTILTMFTKVVARISKAITDNGL
jgi:pilus assembly protein Flp/PilA